VHPSIFIKSKGDQQKNKKIEIEEQINNIHMKLEETQQWLSYRNTSKRR
jgi:hypothetical protein